MADENTLAGRVSRYAKVGSAVGGLAARLVGERYLGMTLDRGRHAADLKAALGGLKGPLMKVAQILSTIPDALPPDYTVELAELQANAPPMGWPFVKRRMSAELGPDWAEKFAGFERVAARAASLGQVHRATAHDGRALACKLQYPDMAAAVEADLKQLQLLFALYRQTDKAIDPGPIREELSARLREELDYRREARHLRLYAAMLDGEAGVCVPDVLESLSSGRLLTMTWLEGVPILDVVDASQERRNRLAHGLFRAWYRPFYEYGVIHGDPHLGNYTVAPDDRLNLLDFGCVRIFPARFVGGVIDLYRSLESGDEALAVRAYEVWGFRNLTRETIDVLNLWARFVYGPLLEDRVRRIQEVPSGSYGRDIAHKVHAELRRLGGVTPPREFVFMDRAAIGLGSVFLRLKAEINWHALFHNLIHEFDLAALEARQSSALAAVGLPPAA